MIHRYKILSLILGIALGVAGFGPTSASAQLVLGACCFEEDPPGAVIEDWNIDEIVELDPLETILYAETVEAGTIVPVNLHSFVTETGVLELWCETTDGSNRWKLEFNVRHE